MFTHSQEKLHLSQKLIAFLPDVPRLSRGEAQIQIFVYLLTDTSYVTPGNGGNIHYYIHMLYAYRYIADKNWNIVKIHENYRNNILES